jgi:DNA-binding MarR family transcriptional regulator/N-acetylglutamate synthase-like GNAT family acetyltransferase
MDRPEIVRSFNRFYTKRIHVLQEGILDSPLSLTEARVLFELAHRESPTATDLLTELGLDPGYLSRILDAFVRQGYLTKEPGHDRRQRRLSLTRAGRRAFESLDRKSHQEAAAMLAKLSESDQSQLIASMKSIESILEPQPPAPYVLRSHRPGDIGWITHRHGVLYAQEYGWDEKFEALVAGIAAKFVENFDPKREHCWIADQDGAILGSVTLVKKSATAAKLRLLYVEPTARGMGVGGRLVQECIRFAREAGYRKITLWTNSILLAARRIYEREGFRIVSTKDDFETWELNLWSIKAH